MVLKTISSTFLFKSPPPRKLPGQAWRHRSSSAAREERCWLQQYKLPTAPLVQFARKELKGKRRTISVTAHFLSSLCAVSKNLRSDHSFWTENYTFFLPRETNPPTDCVNHQLFLQCHKPTFLKCMWSLQSRGQQPKQQRRQAEAFRRACGVTEPEPRAAACWGKDRVIPAPKHTEHPGEVEALPCRLAIPHW